MNMRYRTLGRTGIRVGEIGMGCEGFSGKTVRQVREMVDLMDAAGVNCIDLYTPEPELLDNLGRAKGKICSPVPHMRRLAGRAVYADPLPGRGEGQFRRAAPPAADGLGGRGHDPLRGRHERLGYRGAKRHSGLCPGAEGCGNRSERRPVQP